VSCTVLLEGAAFLGPVIKPHQQLLYIPLCMHPTISAHLSLRFILASLDLQCSVCCSKVNQPHTMTFLYNNVIAHISGLFHIPG
jgi:hypothetical protein